MRAIIRGNLVAVTNVPKKITGDYETRAHQLLQVLQADDNGAVLVNVKDYDLRRVHQIGDVELTCDVRLWQQGSRAGMSVSVVQ